MNFTPKEQQYIAMIAHTGGIAGNIGWNAMVLVPITALGCYGLMRSDLSAVELAFFMLLAFVVWHISTGLRGFVMLRSIFRKVLGLEGSEKDDRDVPA